MAYSFDMLGPVFTAEHFRQQVEAFFAAAPNGWPCWAFSNHDVQRHVSPLGLPVQNSRTIWRGWPERC